MAESQAYIRFTGVTPDTDRKKLYGIFCKFGKITKLYLSPHNDFGKVYLDSTENCDRAYKVLKSNCDLKLTYVAPNSHSTSKYNDISSNSSGSCADPAYRDNSDDGVQANVTNNLVDVFGRIVTTLQDDYGNIYVSLNELKQSGFELFELGSLPARDGSRFHNQQKLHQFEMYMKAQANKFMLETHFDVPAHTVDDVIEKEKRSFFDIGGGGGVGTNSNTKSPDVRRDRSKSRGYQSPRSNRQEQNSNESFHSNKGSAITYNGNESRQSRNQHSRSEMNRSKETTTNYNSNEIQRNRSQHSHSEINRSKEITVKQEKYDQEVNGNVKPIEKIKPLMQVPIVLNEHQQVTVIHVESNHVVWVHLKKNKTVIQTLQNDTIEECQKSFPITPVLFNICGALSGNVWCRAIVLNCSPIKVLYIDFGNTSEENVKEVRRISNKLTSIPAQAIRIIVPYTLVVNTDVTIIARKQMHDGTYILDQVISDTSKLTDANTETPLKLRQPRSVTPVMKECDKSEKKLNRKLVIDQISDAGIFQFCEKTSDQTFTGFALPDAYGNEFEMLSEIGSNSTYDSKFIPNVGDVVGVEHDGDVARGLILSTTMGKYTCTLIDYGTTKVTHEVRQLPEKYTLIPEFSFECEANANIIQQLQETNSTIAMRIKTPSKLRLCLESGETYELIGRPIPFSPLKNEKVDTPQVITTPPRKVEECPIEKSPSNISKQKTVNEDKKSDETIFMPRKLVIEDLSERGTFDFIAKTSDTTFTCFICPEKYLAELNHLEMIYKDTSLDKSFKPQIGDLVAANSSDDGVVRAVVLNISDEKYECALIDYGTIQWISDVRLLPEKYVNIPEFVCECRADPEITKDLANLKKTHMQIRSLNMITIISNTGKEYVVKGFHWNPLRHKTNDTQSKSEECLSRNATNASKHLSLNTRLLVIDKTSPSGIFEFAERIDENTFLGCVVPTTFGKEVGELQQLNKNLSQLPSINPNPGDLVAAPTINGFARAVVVNCSNKQFTCAFIDYGFIKNVDEVRYLPDKYKMIPEFAFQCTADPKVIEDLEQFKCQSMTIKVPGTLTLTVENGKQHIVKGYRWDPTKLHVNSIKKDNQCKAYKRPASMLLKDTDKVMIVGTLNDYLLVRNKECHATFTAVCQELANYEGKPYEQPEVGCLAISNFKDENLYRVAINKIDGGIATLDYIDYGNIDSVPINGLKTINEKIATMNSTVINIHLKDFTQHKFSKKMLELLMNCNEKREKFNAHKISGEKDVYDLIGMDGVSLTERLNKVENNVTTPKLTMENKSATPQSQDKNYCTTPKSQGENKSVKFNLPETSTPKSHRVAEPVCRLKDILKCDMKPGNLALLCTHVGNLNEGQVSFCKADDETSMILVYIDEMISKFIEKDTSTSYIPTSSEVCLAKFDGDWFRAAVVKVDNFNKFGVYFVDYGNHCIVDSTDIRKLPAELSTTKAQAMVCRLDGVVKENGKTVTDALLSRLVVDIVESEIYTAEITSVCDNMYYIIIPSLLKQWKSDGLL